MQEIPTLLYYGCVRVTRNAYDENILCARGIPATIEHSPVCMSDLDVDLYSVDAQFTVHTQRELPGMYAIRNILFHLTQRAIHRDHAATRYSSE